MTGIKEETVWILTTEYNDYDQYGAYFVSAFQNKPGFRELKRLTGENDIIVLKLIRDGGGRQGIENKWYNLIEVKNGVNYH